MGDVCLWLIESKNQASNQMTCEESSGLELGSTSGGNHLCLAIQLDLAIVVLCVHCDLSILLYHSDTSYSHAMSNTDK